MHLPKTSKGPRFPPSKTNPDAETQQEKEMDGLKESFISNLKNARKKHIC